MNPRNACSHTERLSKKTLLAMLPSDVDPDQVIVAATGAVLNVTDQSPKTINANLRNKTWLPLERSSPRKFLVYQESKWTIDSFDPRTKQVCVTYQTGSGERHLNFTLPGF